MSTVRQPRLVKLKEWAQMVFGDHIPHEQTLRNWVRDGYIQPPPEKIGKFYYVKPDAKYKS